jgi:hypothetical protein
VGHDHLEAPLLERPVKHRRGGALVVGNQNAYEMVPKLKRSGDASTSRTLGWTDAG